ncbi:hypothetical protein HYH03_010283 [Edaphochlamys debaryana]|uniref:Uncharacterized protein n=1 Tax=Edaphochlamys debaryana TaxID=47281 RepID=A0A836BW24_9CHLO|nr:hypothetical protein HYH03_010283 [Edaphochlamys debaryana]|eukprot:KAG2491276.1 hypothetical protein HYH03_010283 [Edaphochlamys debaryana]
MLATVVSEGMPEGAEYGVEDAEGQEYYEQDGGVMHRPGSGRGPSRLAQSNTRDDVDAEGYYQPEADGEAAGYDGVDEQGTSGDGSAGWPSDPEAMLALLQQQRAQYRSWVAQCAATALAALDPDYGSEGGGESEGGSGRFPASSLPDDVPGMVAAMDVAGQARHHLLLLKAAAEAVREAGRASTAFGALALPSAEAYGDPSEAAAGEAAEAEYVSAAYAVTTAVAAAVAAVDAYKEHAAAAAAAAAAASSGAEQSSTSAAGSLLPPDLDGPLARRLDALGAELCRRLRQEASVLMGRLKWPPPLASSVAAVGADGAGGGGAGGEDDAFPGFEAHPVLARRLVGVLTALTHHQMAVKQRAAFFALLSGQQGAAREQGEEEDDGGADAGAHKPLLWAAQVLAAPIASKLKAHFHPAAPAGRLDRPSWLFGTVLDCIRRHGHSLASLDDMLACLQLKPHYNMPAELARALQEEVLALLREERLPALLARQAQAAAAEQEAGEDGLGGESEEAAAASAAAATAEALWMGVMDAAAAYDTALLPLLGATGHRVEAEAARASSLLTAEAAPRGRRAADLLDPTAGGTADMQLRFVAVAAVAGVGTGDAAGAAGPGAGKGEPGSAGGAEPAAPSGGPTGPLLSGWAAAEGGAALRALEAVAYDETSLAPAEEVARRALGASGEDGLDGPDASGPQPWQRHTWPSVLSAEAAAALDGLVARSRWLHASPEAQRDFLAAAAGPLLALLRRRLGRVVDSCVARGEALSEQGLPKVCSALCSAAHLDDHIASLLATDLAPLVDALAAAGAAAGEEDGSAGTPSSSAAGARGAQGGKLGGGGGGGFWGGLLAAAGGNGSTASPGRAALRDGVSALAGGVGSVAAGSVVSTAVGPSGGAAVLGEAARGFARLHRDGCLKLAREVALGFGRCSVAYRHAIEANPQFPFTPEDGEGEGMDPGAYAAAADGEGGPTASITPSFAPALLFLQASGAHRSRSAHGGARLPPSPAPAAEGTPCAQGSTTLDRLSRLCDKATFADVWRGAALSINRFMFNFIATESRFTRAGARQFAADVAGLAALFAPYSRRGGSAAGGQHFRELQAAARLLCAPDEQAADVMRRASAAAVAAAAGGSATASCAF